MIFINKYIPFKGFIAMAIFPIIFVRKEYEDKLNKRIEVHEKIHFEQQKELLLILFYIWYILEFIIKGFIYSRPYKNISFEREANARENDLEYLKNRKRFAFLKYIFKK